MFCIDSRTLRCVIVLACALGLTLAHTQTVQAQETGDLMGRVIAGGTESPIETALILIEGSGAGISYRSL
jgi:hypothetical protein